MVPVAVTGKVTDNCAGPAVCQIVAVSGNEPIDGLVKGDTAPDCELTGDLNVSLRAERSGTSDGRIYPITVKCIDAAGNSTTKTVTVTVAGDQARKGSLTTAVSWATPCRVVDFAVIQRVDDGHDRSHARSSCNVVHYPGRIGRARIRTISTETSGF